ncbi:hypothetical protein LIER_26666 [Lithospermum erythrorhizon]|uniref:Uncharacterized protein n=1 Tax=Lithospermum erythrorhizon TaxID=34254 RepID=A0AAV3R965_LITER
MYWRLIPYFPLRSSTNTWNVMGDMKDTKFIMKVCMNNSFKRIFVLSTPKEVYDQLSFDFIERLKSKHYEMFCTLISMNNQNSHISDMMKLIGLLRYSGISISGTLAKEIIQGIYPEESPGSVSTHDPVKAEFSLSLIYKKIIGDKYERDTEKFCFTPDALKQSEKKD